MGVTVAWDIGVGNRVAVSPGPRTGTGLGEGLSVMVGAVVAVVVTVPTGDSNAGGDWKIELATAFPEAIQARATANKTRPVRFLAVRRCVRTIGTGLIADCHAIGIITHPRSIQP